MSIWEKGDPPLDFVTSQILTVRNLSVHVYKNAIEFIIYFLNVPLVLDAIKGIGHSPFKFMELEREGTWKFLLGGLGSL